ncbi:hypothetical protein MTR67_023902 [Solanum verrucosum]|uniref:Uncharacterized protein n=1 Tax=Solanum verrucosum TaxID=315347 RepID=A0AAF0TRU9_SOLVR|nr:hypothetical protein MTR67_023902 [Solanum verrucosum]
MVLECRSRPGCRLRS